MSDLRLPYTNREQAGRVLADAGRTYRGRDDLLVLALPRGGVPVGAELAKALDAPLDVCIVRKLGAPGQPELAMGAIAMGGARVLNRAVIDHAGISEAAIEEATRREQRELDRRNHDYRGDRPLPTIRDRCVLLVDDGIATGSTMRAAIAAVRQQQPTELVVAVPVAPRESIEQLATLVDTVVCPATPEWFFSVGQWYTHYEQTTDEQVRALLEEAWRRERMRSAP